MKWKKFRLETLSAAEDVVSGILADNGVEGVEIEDKVPLSESDKARMFVDIPLDPGADDGIAYVTFYLDEEADSESVLRAVQTDLEETREYMDLGTCRLETSETEDVDWVNSWKKYFHQFTIDDILITPSWEKPQASDSDKMIIHIDPGTAFGTGKHETTRSCIRALRREIREGDKFLDVGTGSGILMMMALKFGAGSAVGTDLDPKAIPAVKENMEANAVPADQYKFYLGNLITDESLCREVGFGSFDAAAANILAEVLIPLAPVMYKALKPGGVYVMSGIIDFKEEEVRKAVEANGFSVTRVDHDGEWVCVTARRGQ